MSKRDKRNRFISSQGDGEPEGIDFQELSEDESEMDEFQTTAIPVSVDAQSRQTNQVDAPTGSDSNDEDDNDQESLFQFGWRKIIGILPVFSMFWRGVIFCCGKTKGGTLAAFSGSVGLVKKLAPYCTLSWGEDEEEDTETENENKANVNAKSNANAHVDVNTDAKSKTVAEIKSAELKKADVKSAVVDYEDDEVAPSRLGLYLKVASVTLAASILLGGIYFGYSKFFKTTNPADAPTEEVATISQPQAAEPVKEPEKNEPKTGQPQDIAKTNETYPPKTNPPASNMNDPWQTAAAAPASPSAASSAVDRDWSLSSFDQPQPKADVPEAAKKETAKKEDDAKKEDKTQSLLNPSSFDLSMLDEQQEPPKDSLTKDSLKQTISQDAEIASAPVSRNKQRTSSPMEPLSPVQGQVAEKLKPKSELAPLVVQSSIPQAVSSSVYDKTASQFTDKPVAPTATQNIPKKELAQPTVMMPTPVRENTPTIPQSGNIQAITSQAQFKNHVSQNGIAQNKVVPGSNRTPPKSRSGEPGLMIPKDTVMQTNQPLAATNTPVLVAQKTQPLGTQLKQQVQTLRQNNAADSEAEQNMKLRFDRTNRPADIHNGVQNAVAADKETRTLRFTPKPKTLVTTQPNALDTTTLETLLPNSTDSATGVDANAKRLDITNALPPLKDAPKAQYAEINPAYRNANANVKPLSNPGESRQSRLTYKGKIASQIKNSPDTTLTYVVQPDDTYMTISDKFYGTSLLYTALAAHNRKLNIGWQPAEGAVIEIPTTEQLQANYSDVINRLERRLSTSTTTGVKYVVQEGDTLMSVAMDKLHNSSRWHEILAMNTDKLPGPRDLHPGMEIMIPADMTYRSVRR